MRVKQSGNKVEMKSNMAFSTLLTVAFVVLKLVGVIDWSWWWVVSPLLINIVFVLIMLAVLIWFVRKTDKY